MMLDYWCYKCVPAVTDERKNSYGNVVIFIGFFTFMGGINEDTQSSLNIVYALFQ